NGDGTAAAAECAEHADRTISRRRPLRPLLRPGQRESALCESLRRIGARAITLARGVLWKDMLRPYKGVQPRVAADAYVDVSAQVIGDVDIGPESSVWMNVVM